MTWKTSSGRRINSLFSPFSPFSVELNDGGAPIVPPETLREALWPSPCPCPCPCENIVEGVRPEPVSVYSGEKSRMDWSGKCEEVDVGGVGYDAE